MRGLIRAVSWPTYAAAPGRLLLLLGGIALGVALIVALGVINASVLANFRATLERAAGKASLQVELGAGEVGFPQALVKTVKDTPGVARAIGLVRGTLHVLKREASASDDPSGDVLQLFGVDLLNDGNSNTYDVHTLDGRAPLDILNSETPVVLIGEEYGRRRRISVDDQLRVATPTGIVSLRVGGLLRTSGLATVFGGNLAVMNLLAAQKLFAKQERVDQIDVVLTPEAEGHVSEVRERLIRALPSSLSVTRPSLKGERFERAIAAFQAMLDGLSFLCMLASVFIVSNTMATAVAERAQQLAILRTLGAPRRRIERLVLGEAALIGIVGSMFGVGLGLTLAYLLTSLVSQSIGIIYQVRVPDGGLSLTLPRAGWYVLLGTVGAVLAAWVPARQAGRLDPINLMRPDYREQLVGTSPDRLWLGLGVSMLGASAVAVYLEQAGRSPQWGLVLGNIAASLWWLAGLFFAVPAMSILTRAIASVLPRIAGLPGHVAAGGLRRAPVRTGVTVAVIGLSLTLAVGLASVAHSFQESFRNWFTLAGDLVVSAVGTEGGWLESPLGANVGKILSNIPGVVRVETYRALQGQPFVLPGSPSGERRIAIVAISPGFIDTPQFRSAVVAGDAEQAIRAIADGQEVLVSESLADRYDLAPGDHIPIPAPAGPMSVRINAVVTADFSGDQGSIIMNRELFKNQWAGDDQVNHFNVFLDPTTKVETARDAIEQALNNQYVVKVLTVPRALAYHQDMIDRAFAFTYAIQLLVIAVTLAGIADLLITQVIERRREIGVLKVLGADDPIISRAVWLEALLIGLAGAMLGAVISVGTSYLWVRINFPLLIGYVVQHHFAYMTAVHSTVLAGLVALLAGWLAARRALREPVLSSLRYE